MRNILITFFIFVLLVVGCSKDNKEKKLPEYGYSTGNGVNVREGKSFSFKVVDKIYKGEKVKILEREKDSSQRLALLRRETKVTFQDKTYVIPKGKALFVDAKTTKGFHVSAIIDGQKIGLILQENEIIDIIGYVKVITPRGKTGWTVLKYIKLAGTNNSNSKDVEKKKIKEEVPVSKATINQKIDFKKYAQKYQLSKNVIALKPDDIGIQDDWILVRPDGALIPTKHKFHAVSPFKNGKALVFDSDAKDLFYINENGRKIEPYLKKQIEIKQFVKNTDLYVINIEGIKLKERPNFSSKTLTQINYKESVTFLSYSEHQIDSEKFSSSTKWIKISYKNFQGYIPDLYVVLFPAPKIDDGIRGYATELIREGKLYEKPNVLKIGISEYEETATVSKTYLGIVSVLINSPHGIHASLLYLPGISLEQTNLIMKILYYDWIGQNKSYSGSESREGSESGENIENGINELNYGYLYNSAYH